MQTNRGSFLDYLARCRQAFRPFSPIDLPDFFRGREEHVKLLTSELHTPGRQVAIYGERGVGKTSLAMLASFFARFDDESTHFVRCEADHNYDDIFGQLLVAAGYGTIPEEVEIESRRGLRLGLSQASVSRARAKRSRERSIPSATRIGPAMLLRFFRDRDGLLIVDEYDRVGDQPTDTRLAETLKHFSDARSKTKIIVVGVSDSLSDLVGEHRSLTRCLAQVKLDRMKDNELGEIISTGEERASVIFEQSVRQKIIALSDGFPFYTHLLCLYSAEEAGQILQRNPDAKVVVTDKEYRRAVQRAITTGEASLSDVYRSAIVTVKRKTEMFKYVLWGVAYSQASEVQVKEIAENIGLLTGTKPRIESLSTYLGKLTKPEKREILLRVRQGYYRFANPLMRAYIRIILEQHNFDLTGQLQFPWMGETRS